MANAKRASMREGPLAALFRKTEEQEERGGAAHALPRAGGAGRGRRAAHGRRAAPAPKRPARGTRGRARAAQRESGLPHPALSRPTLAPEREEDLRALAAGASAPRLLLGDTREPHGPPAIGTHRPAADRTTTRASKRSRRAPRRRSGSR